MKKIQSLPITMTEQEALQVARQGGNVFGKWLLGKKDITLKLMYLENREYVLDMTYQNAPLLKLVRPNALKTVQQFCTLVEGTRCGASYLECPLETVEIEVEESQLQPSTYSDTRLLQVGKSLCRRMLRRQLGKNVLLDVAHERKVYRPYYVAFYGEMTEGTRVRYLPIPADGNSVERAC